MSTFRCYPDQATRETAVLDPATLQECTEVCAQAQHCTSFTFRAERCELLGPFRSSSAVFCTSDDVEATLNGRG